MIIEPSPDKDIEAQRGDAGPSSVQGPYVGPSTSTSADYHEEYEYVHTNDANEDDRLLGGANPLPGAYQPDPVTPGPQFEVEEPLGPPPKFAPYEAEWFEVGYGDIVSHDEHLNTDGEPFTLSLSYLTNPSAQMTQEKRYTGSSSPKPLNVPRAIESTVVAHTAKRAIGLLTLITIPAHAILASLLHGRNHTTSASRISIFTLTLHLLPTPHLRLLPPL
jgi:hypothetical protein